MSDSGMVEKSSLASELERFEAHYSYGDDETLNTTGWTIKQIRWEAWQAASAGRQELLEVLRQAEKEVGFRMSNALIRRVYAAIDAATGEQP